MLEQLSDIEKEKFIDVVNKLFFKKYIIEKIYDKKKEYIVLNPDYRFIEIHKLEFEEYLDYAGWKLNEDRNNGVFSISNTYISYNINLGRNTTIIMYILRLMYEEKQQELTLTSAIYFTLAELLEKGNILGVIADNPPKTVLVNSLRFLKKYGIIEKIKGVYGDINSLYILYPTIVHLVNSQNIVATLKTFKEETTFYSCEADIFDEVHNDELIDDVTYEELENTEEEI